MDINKYEALLRSIDLGSFSSAAVELGYTAAGISRMVTSIEDELGFPLLKRTHSGVTLTKEGQNIIENIRSIVKQELLLRQKSTNLTGLETGTVTVGSYFSIATHWLPKIFHDFLKDYPGITIQLREGGHQLLNQWMEESTVDFCLTSYDSSFNYNWFPLRDDRMVVAVPHDHPFALKNAVTIEECLSQPLIMPALGQDYDVMRILKSDASQLNIKFSTVENYAALSMVENGLGISIMNELITKGMPCNVVLLDFAPPQFISLGIAIPSIQAASPAEKKLISYIRRLV